MHFVTQCLIVFGYLWKPFYEFLEKFWCVFLAHFECVVVIFVQEIMVIGIEVLVSTIVIWLQKIFRLVEQTG